MLQRTADLYNIIEKEMPLPAGSGAGQTQVNLVLF